MLDWWEKNFATRTQPDTNAIELLNPLENKVMSAKSPKLPKVLTVAWAVEAIAKRCCVRPWRLPLGEAQNARLGGYLEHRHKTPIGIQVLWRGWLKLHDKSEGWQRS